MSEQRKATPAETLKRRIVDPCIPKSEAEWWAHREIAKQREESKNLRAEIERLRADAADIATIAHSGGLTGLSEAEALVAIRRLTLRAWADRHGRTGSRQVRSALEAKP
jgi:hypothetical protein